MGHEGVGWVIQGLGGSYRGVGDEGVDHAEVGWGRVSRTGVRWVM